MNTETNNFLWLLIHPVALIINSSLSTYFLQLIVFIHRSRESPDG